MSHPGAFVVIAAVAITSLLVNELPAGPSETPPVAPAPHRPGEKPPEETKPAAPGSEKRIDELRKLLETIDDPAREPKDRPLTGKAGDPGGADLYPGRSGATRAKLIRERGGSAESEKAVALGLEWLAKQQKKDGNWEFDQGEKKETVAATGLALLPFLGAGETHKAGKYKDTVKKGLDWLVKHCPPEKLDPDLGPSNLMYAQAIGTIALCEALGMTRDPDLKSAAQSALNFIQKAQSKNGSWGYRPGMEGDTSITGWQVQAIQAARRTRGLLVVDDQVIKKAVGFLNSAAAGSRKAMYGYANAEGAAHGTALTAVGLLCRYNIDGWGPYHPGLIDGVGGLLKNPPTGKGALKNLYYFYHATQVLHFYEGEDWKNWNEGPKQADGSRTGGMRDWLVGAQVRKDGPDMGSWDPEAGYFGSSCGRLGTTAVCILTLEIYYRHSPLYKRATDEAVKIIEDIK
jgi:hypothetical protein